MKRFQFKVIRPLSLWIIHLLGSDITDVRTGQTIGRVLLLPWRGRIVVLGKATNLVPAFQPEPDLVQWKRTLGFTQHPPPDFSHEPRP